MVCSAADAFGGSLVAGDVEVRDGYHAVPIVFQAGDQARVASMQFEVDYDPSAFDIVDIEMGEAAADAVKAPVYSEPANGRTRVIVAGLNQNEIHDGVVAYVVLAPKGDIVPERPIDFRSVVFSDPDGVAADFEPEPADDEEPRPERPEPVENDPLTSPSSDSPSLPMEGGAPRDLVTAGGTSLWPYGGGLDAVAQSESSGTHIDTIDGPTAGNEGGERTQVADASSAQRRAFGRQPQRPLAPRSSEPPVLSQSNPSPATRGGQRLTQVGYAFRDSALLNEPLAIHIGGSRGDQAAAAAGIRQGRSAEFSQAAVSGDETHGFPLPPSPGWTAAIAAAGIFSILLSLRRRLFV